MTCTLASTLRTLSRKGYRVIAVNDKEYSIDDFVSTHGKSELHRGVNYMEFRLWAEIYEGDDADSPIAVVKL